MGLFLKKLFRQKLDAQKREPQQVQSQEKMSSVEKELFLVNRMTIEDMQEIANAPFVWNGPLRKHIQERSHPFAYMDIIGENINNAKRELQRMNERIVLDSAKFPDIPAFAKIPIEDIVFKPSKLYGHTCIICTPKTIKGRIAKHPFKLFFCTDLSDPSETHGEIIYDNKGNISAANIYCWKKGAGFLLYYKTINGELTLSSRVNSGFNA